MIKANELRIGNKIYLELGLFGLNIHTITGQDIADISNGRITLASISPIPLAPDILEKCGFAAREGYDFPTYEDQYGDRISFDAGIWKYWLGGIYQDWAEIRSLHRLQNFYFEYTNRELEVQL